ncbi:MAG: sulfatase family protein [Anaerolineae bacterium]
MAQPNIVYIHSHDTGRYIQPYGHAVATPNLQRLAEQGVIFRQAFCVGPTCSPSRAALLTGQAPHNAGMLGLVNRGFQLRDPAQHIVHTLRRAGYTSTLAGMQHVARDPRTIGYDEVLPKASAGVQDVAPAAVQFLGSRPRQPFFLDVGFSETHRPFHSAGESEDARYTRPPAPLPDTPETRRDMADFQASARIYDGGVGMVLAALEEAGLTENTLVIATTDHGIAFPGMKCTLTDHGMGVMLILRGPEGFRGGKVCDAMVSHTDLFPTLCELAGTEVPAWVQGRSLLSLMRGETEEIHEAVYGEITYHDAYEPQRAVRTRRWKYIRRFDGRSRPVVTHADDGLSKEVWMAHGWRDRPVAEEQLYDLVFDPNEGHNLAADSAHGDALAEMRARLERWMVETQDPLLRGPAPLPEDAVASDPDDLHSDDLWTRIPRRPGYG